LIEDGRIFFQNLEHDPHHTLDGLLCIQIFCNMATPLESDMRFHLSNMHKKDLIKGYHCTEKGIMWSIELRVQLI
jgi:hypothetical protein